MVSDEILATQQDVDPTVNTKRKVALHIGYVGSAYRGLQHSHKSVPDDGGPPAVEAVLEMAILKAGLMRKENYGEFNKVKWTRSSRTDKGVHALAAVVALKVNCATEHWQRDPEGVELADRINGHLPEDIRVFAVQRVSKKFQGRNYGARRRYAFYLPAHVLQLRDDGSQHDTDTLARLREALSHFIGSRPFHNYTQRQVRVHRQRYRPDQNVPQNGWKKRKKPDSKGDAADAAEPGSAGNSDEDEVDEAQASDVDEAVQPDAAVSTGPTPTAAAPPPDTNGAAAGTQRAWSYGERNLFTPTPEVEKLRESYGEKWMPYTLRLRWHERAEDHRLKVFGAHWRRIELFEASDIMHIGADGAACVKLEVLAGSFMLHQIRHMVGAAVAVARGVLPVEFVSASLAMPASCSVPLAPPHTLVLTGSEFMPFRIPENTETPDYVTVTGDTLQLRAKGSQRQHAFRDGTFHSALVPLLGHSDWEVWSQGLTHSQLDSEELKEWLRCYDDWLERVKERKAALREQQLADEQQQTDEAWASEQGAEAAAQPMA